MDVSYPPFSLRSKRHVDGPHSDTSLTDWTLRARPIHLMFVLSTVERHGLTQARPGYSLGMILIQGTAPRAYPPEFGYRSSL